MLEDYFGESAEYFRYIGAITTVYIAFKIAINLFRFVAKYFLAGLLGLPADLKKAGSWAVVTGCTDGIGKSYAEQIAAKGLNVVLISRTMSKLEVMARDVEEKYNVETKVIAADFSKEDIYEDIKLQLNGLDIGVLVNNVGCSYDHPEYFGELREEDISRKMIHMNCTSVAKMTEIVLETMTPKNQGYIINIGSSAGSGPAPLLALYSGTKAYVEMFTRSLQYEYSKKGILFQYVKPLFVCSKLSKFKKPSTFIPTPNTFVKNALNLVGVESDTTGYWAHEIQAFVMRFVPISMQMSFMENARNKALKKKEAVSKSE